MNKYKLTFNNPMLTESWYVVSDDNLVINISNQVGTAGYAEYTAYEDEALTRELHLLFSPANYSSVEIKNLGKVGGIDE